MLSVVLSTSFRKAVAASDKTQYRGALFSWSSLAPVRQLVLLKVSEQ